MKARSFILGKIQEQVTRVRQALLHEDWEQAVAAMGATATAATVNAPISAYASSSSASSAAVHGSIAHSSPSVPGADGSADQGSCHGHRGNAGTVNSKKSRTVFERLLLEKDDQGRTLTDEEVGDNVSATKSAHDTVHFS